MTLQTISDAAYLVCPKARIRMEGCPLLGNKDRKLYSMTHFSSSPKSSKTSWGQPPSPKLESFTSTHKPLCQSEHALSRRAIHNQPRRSSLTTTQHCSFVILVQLGIERISLCLEEIVALNDLWHYIIDSHQLHFSGASGVEFLFAGLRKSIRQCGSSCPCVRQKRHLRTI